MICPRWLVQSSAVGAAGFALIAIPLWMDPGSSAAEQMRPEVSEVEPVELVAEWEWEAGWTMTCGPPSVGRCVDGW